VITLVESSDPEFLHTRISVLECDNRRHNEDLNQLWGRVSALEICAASLPDIKNSLALISTKVDALTSCLTKEDGKSEGKAIAYLSIREWLLVSAAIVAVLLEHFYIK
jgi:hypothetical protein